MQAVQHETSAVSRDGHGNRRRVEGAEVVDDVGVVVERVDGEMGWNANCAIVGGDTVCVKNVADDLRQSQFGLEDDEVVDDPVVVGVLGAVGALHLHRLNAHAL